MFFINLYMIHRLHRCLRLLCSSVRYVSFSIIYRLHRFCSSVPYVFQNLCSSVPYVFKIFCPSVCLRCKNNTIHSNFGCFYLRFQHY